MKTKTKKKKQVRKGDVHWTSQNEADYIKAWEIYIKREGTLLNALLRKRDLEQKLSLVRVEIIDICIDSTKRNIVNGNKKYKDNINSKDIKIAKRKRIIDK